MINLVATTNKMFGQDKSLPCINSITINFQLVDQQNQMHKYQVLESSQWLCTIQTANYPCAASDDRFHWLFSCTWHFVFCTFWTTNLKLTVTENIKVTMINLIATTNENLARSRGWCHTWLWTGLWTETY